MQHFGLKNDMVDGMSEVKLASVQKFTDYVKNMRPLFIVTVILPTVLAAIYYGLVASDVYTSQSAFIVRTQGKEAPTGLASFLMGGGIGGSSGSEVSAVQEYSVSRDALAVLDRNGRIRNMYSRPGIDWFSKLGGFGQVSFEKLHHYYTGKVTIENDSKTSITSLQVRAYRPEDAQWINEKLLQLSEALVNRLNQRSRIDTIRYAQLEVSNAQQRARNAADALANFRDKYQVVDPEEQAAVSLQMISKLQDELIAAKAGLAQIRTVAPESPQIVAVEAQIQALEHEIRGHMTSLAGDRDSLAGKATAYARLRLENELAGKLLTAAMASLENAKNEAQRQQVYIDRIVQPDRPDEATQPRRMRNVFAVFVVGLVSWGVLTMLLAAMREHQQ